MSELRNYAVTARARSSTARHAPHVRGIARRGTAVAAVVGVILAGCLNSQEPDPSPAPPRPAPVDVPSPTPVTAPMPAPPPPATPVFGPAPPPAPGHSSRPTAAPAPGPAPTGETVASQDSEFPDASAVLSSSAKARLNEFADRFRGSPTNFAIAVASSSVGETPTPEAAQTLAILRAEAVKSYLVQRGVDASRVYTETRTETQPSMTSGSGQGQTTNRRFEVEIAPVVYNADIAPQLPRDPSVPDRAVLRAGVPAALSFDIGPRALKSLLPPMPAASGIVNSAADVPLTVVMACGFCEPESDAMKRITFRPIAGRSEAAVFQLTPKPRLGVSAYVEKLSLAIINDQTGREYDRIVLPVSVTSDGTTSPGGPVNAAVRMPSTGVDGTAWRPDVLLYATVETDRNVTISIQPVSEAMKQTLDPLALDAQGNRRTFRTGIDDPLLIDAMTTSAYGAMTAVSLQGELLKKLSATGIDAAVSTASQDSLSLSDDEATKVTGVIAMAGQSLYRRMFSSSADTDLRKLILKLEAAAAVATATGQRPLRLMVVTNRLSLPWQYLHPVGPQVDATKFWGMQFNLSVLRVNNSAREKAVPDRTKQVRQVVFARYGSSIDKTIPLADKQAAQLRKAMTAESDLLDVDTGSDLLSKLRDQRKYIGSIVTFLHASAGAGSTAPSLQFNDGDLVTSDGLEDLLSKVPAEEQDQRFLAGGPLVILNACETGPARSLPYVKLQDAMFDLGAQGVLVTEVSVWITLGHEVATQLIDRLIRGEPVADALTAVRRELQQKKKNPLGLLYVYYGDPAATLPH